MLVDAPMSYDVNVINVIEIWNIIIQEATGINLLVILITGYSGRYHDISENDI